MHMNFIYMCRVSVHIEHPPKVGALLVFLCAFFFFVGLFFSQKSLTGADRRPPHRQRRHLMPRSGDRRCPFDVDACAHRGQMSAGVSPTIFPRELNPDSEINRPVSLRRLQHLGLLQHRRPLEWKG